MVSHDNVLQCVLVHWNLLEHRIAMLLLRTVFQRLLAHAFYSQVETWARCENLEANYADLVMTSLLQVVLLGAAPLLEIDQARSAGRCL